MSKAKMIAARELIQERKFDEARAILMTVDHPKAKEWLERIDQIETPEANDAKGAISKYLTRPYLLALAIGFVAVVLFALIAVIYQFNSAGSLPGGARYKINAFFESTNCNIISAERRSSSIADEVWCVKIEETDRCFLSNVRLYPIPNADGTTKWNLVYAGTHEDREKRNWEALGCTY